MAPAPVFSTKAPPKAAPAFEEYRTPAADTRPWWEQLPKPSMGQLFIVFSFGTIITLMIATVAVVYNAGGIHYNDS